MECVGRGGVGEHGVAHGRVDAGEDRGGLWRGVCGQCLQDARGRYGVGAEVRRDHARHEGRDRRAVFGELDDRAPFKIAGAIVTVEKKFTRKEGKPFAVVWVEDLNDMLEVVVWNEVYVKISDALVAGRVIEIRGTLDKRDDALRATAQEIKVFMPDDTKGTNERSTSLLQEEAVLLQFSRDVTSNELREVREILASSPGRRPVQLLFDRANGSPLRLDAGAEFHVDLTRDLEKKLSRWLIPAKAERKSVMVDSTST